MQSRHLAVSINREDSIRVDTFWRRHSCDVRPPPLLLSSMLDAASRRIFVHLNSEEVFKMNSFIKCNIFKFVCDLRVQVPQVRLYEKKAYVRRFGYKDKVLTKGLLPRHKDFKPVKEMPAYEPKNAWAEKRALFGQNDYIDILGDGNIHPTRLLTHIPYYLRGIRGNEYKIAIRRMKVFGENWSHMRPQKFVDFTKRMRYLHGYFNSLQNR